MCVAGAVDRQTYFDPAEFDRLKADVELLRARLDLAAMLSASAPRSGCRACSFACVAGATCNVAPPAPGPELSSQRQPKLRLHHSPPDWRLCRCPRQPGPASSLSRLQRPAVVGPIVTDRRRSNCDFPHCDRARRSNSCLRYPDFAQRLAVRLHRPAVQALVPGTLERMFHDVRLAEAIAGVRSADLASCPAAAKQGRSWPWNSTWDRSWPNSTYPTSRSAIQQGILRLAPDRHRLQASISKIALPGGGLRRPHSGSRFVQGRAGRFPSQHSSSPESLSLCSGFELANCEMVGLVCIPPMMGVAGLSCCCEEAQEAGEFDAGEVFFGLVDEDFVSLEFSGRAVAACFGSTIFGIVTATPWPVGFAPAAFAVAACNLPRGSVLFGGFALAAFVCARTEPKSASSEMDCAVDAPRADAETDAGRAAELFDGIALVATDATRMHQGLPAGSGSKGWTTDGSTAFSPFGGEYRGEPARIA